MKTQNAVSLILAGLLLLVATSAFADSQPAIAGQISGIELCPQFICGSAIFSGVFHGTVDSKSAKGSFSVSVNHQPLPTTAGDSSAIKGGSWFIMTKKDVFTGDITTGTITNNDANIPNTFVIAATLGLDQGGSGTIYFCGILNHNEFPPTITGTISQFQVPCP
jgi:hypothetical protein